MITSFLRRTKHLFFVILSLTTMSAWAQTVSKQLSNADGLSNNSVNCIFEDSGYTIWVGTWDGLNAYNGREFKTYRYNKNNEHSISNNVIRQIIEQDSAHIWVATDFGVNLFNKRKQEFTNYFLGTDKKAPKQEQSFLLSKTSQNRIICYVNEVGLFYFDSTRNVFKEALIDSLESNIKSFVIDSDNNIYFLSSNGRLQRSKVTIQQNTLVFAKLEYLERSTPISSIFLSDDKLILNCREYLKIMNSTTPYPIIGIDRNKNVSQVILHNGAFIISYYEGDCLKYDLKTKSYSNITGIPERTSIFSTYISSQNILWFGTDGQGLYKIYEHNSPFRTVKTNHPVRSFCEDWTGNNILVGTKGDGVKLLNKQSGLLSDYLSINNGLLSNSVYAIRKNKSGDIFIGTENEGVNIIRANNKFVEKLILPSPTPKFRAVYSICFTNNDSTLWLGTSGYGLIKIGLKRINNTYHAHTVEQYISSDKANSLNNNIIYSINPSADQQYLWIGTRGGGINRFGIQNKKFSRLNDFDASISLSSNDILVLLTDTKQNLWIGTSYGLNHIGFTPSPTHKEYTDHEGLANNTIHGILEDENNNIWISTNLGISYINQTENKISNYTIKDGLHNDEFADGAYLEDGNNTLYFGGVGGISYFKPDEIHLRNFQPKLGLASLRIFNTPQNIYERIENNDLKLANDESQVTFTFIAYDYINNENCEYSYRLKNLSDEWINNGNNPNIVFTKLPPGKYILEVKCTNGDKVWSDDIYTITIDVAYPWWLSTWAFIIYVVLALIAAYIVQSVVKNRIRLSRQVLLEHIEKQHQQKIHESRLNFFTNVAHEFFTPLTLIYGPAQFLLEKSDLDNSTKHYIQIIKNNADRMQKLINELMEFRKLESGHTPLHPENVDIRMMIDYVSDNYSEIAEENKISFEIFVDEVSNIVTDRNSLEKILFNLISNAFKYTPIGGNISIASKQGPTNQTLYFTIKNTGKGLTQKQMSQLFSKFKIFENTKLKNSTSTGIGLSLTKSLVELLGGTIKVTSELGEYVLFSIEIPPLQSIEKIEKTESKDEENIVRFAAGGKIHKKTDINILVVEDERNIRELLNDILSPYYNIEEAENGEDALSKIELNVPDIIISDVLMPKIDGMTLISKLKANQRTKHIPIVSISAKNSAEDHISAYEHGADLYITKPFHPRHVLTAVENLIGKNLILKEYFNSSRSSITIIDGVELHSQDERFLQDIVSFIENNLEDETLNPNSISDFMGISKATLYRKLKELTDKTPSEYVRYIRLEYASKLLITTKLTVAEIMFKSGFANKSYFYREFAKQYRLSPMDYRKAKAQ